jgi:hypothetical protein
MPVGPLLVARQLPSLTMQQAPENLTVKGLNVNDGAYYPVPTVR